jgi:hypothetical protein
LVCLRLAVDVDAFSFLTVFRFLLCLRLTVDVDAFLFLAVRFTLLERFARFPLPV